MRLLLPSLLLGATLQHPIVTLASSLQLSRAALGVQDEGYSAALTAVTEATLHAGTDPAQALAQLQLALDTLDDYAPLIAVDPHAQRIQLKGRLTFARAALRLGERQAAIAVMDQVVFSFSLVGGLDSFPIETVGPSIGALFRERRAAFEAGNTGRLQLRTPTASSVFIDCRQVSTALVNFHGVELGVGTHQVWVADHIAPFGEPQLRETVEISQHGLVVLEVPDPPADIAPRLIDPVLDDRPPIAAPVLPPARLSPRWVSISLIALGGVQAGVGAAVLAPPHGSGAQAAGTMSLTAGASQLVIGAVLLAIDEVRHKRSATR